MHMSHLHRAEIAARGLFARESLGQTSTRFSFGPAVRNRLKIEIRIRVLFSFQAAFETPFAGA